MMPTLLILIRIITQNSPPRLQDENIPGVYKIDYELIYINKVRGDIQCEMSTLFVVGRQRQNRVVYALMVDLPILYDRS